MLLFPAIMDLSSTIENIVSKFVLITQQEVIVKVFVLGCNLFGVLWLVHTLFHVTLPVINIPLFKYNTAVFLDVPLLSNIWSCEPI